MTVSVDYVCVILITNFGFKFGREERITRRDFLMFRFYSLPHKTEGGMKGWNVTKKWWRKIRTTQYGSLLHDFLCLRSFKNELITTVIDHPLERLECLGNFDYKGPEVTTNHNWWEKLSYGYPKQNTVEQTKPNWLWNIIGKNDCPGTTSVAWELVGSVGWEDEGIFIGFTKYGVSEKEDPMKLNRPKGNPVPKRIYHSRTNVRPYEYTGFPFSVPD